MEEKKQSFFKKVLISIKDFDKYQELAAEKIGRTIGYLLLLMFIFTLIITTVNVYQFSKALKQGVEYFDESITDLQYQEGNLVVNQNQPMIIENTQYIEAKIIIATGELSSEQIENYEKELKDSINGVLLLKDKVVIKNEMVSALTEASYQDFAQKYGINSLTKQDIISYLNGAGVNTIYASVFLAVFAYLYIIYVTSVLVDSLVLAALGYLTCRILGMRIRFGANFNMAVHSFTLPILLNLIYIIVNVFTGFSIKYFQIMYTAISYIYMITAILLIKSDVIKKQLELAKIQEEQEKIKQEIEEKKEQERQEREREEQRRKEKEKEKKEKKKTKPEIGTKPEANPEINNG